MRFTIITLILLLFALPAWAVDTALVDRDGVTQPLVLTPANIGAAPSVAGVEFYPAADDQHAAIEIDQTIHTSTDDRQGAIHATTTGPDTHTGAAANWLEFISTGSLTGGFDTALTTILRNDSISGGTGDAQWWVAATPNQNTGNWTVNGGEINTFNAYADMGYQEDVYSAIKPTSGLYMVPESELNVGRGVGRSLLACAGAANPYACCTGAGTGTCTDERGYNSTYGIMFGRSAGSDYGDASRDYPASKWWVPVYVGKDATAPTGTSILLRGGTAANKSPGVAIKIKDYQTIGIDTSTATISGNAIKLAAGQTIGDTAGNAVTVEQLATLTTGGTTDTAAIHKGGANEISSIDTKTTPAAADYLLVEDSAAGYIKKKIRVDSLPLPASAGTVTSVDSANTDIAVTNKTTTPILTLNTGTGANQIPKLTANGNLLIGTSSDDVRLTIALPQDAGGAALRLDQSINTNAAPSLLFRSSRGSYTNGFYRKQKDDGLAGFVLQGTYADTSDTTTATQDTSTRQFMFANASETWTSTGRGWYWGVKTRATGTTGAPTERFRISDGGMITEGLDDKTASFTVVNSTSRITLTTGTATATLLKTLPAGTTSVLVTVAGAAASGVSFAAESGGSVTFGDAGNPTFTNNKTADVVCTSENAAATTTAAWRCVKGGNF